MWEKWTDTIVWLLKFWCLNRNANANAVQVETEVIIKSSLIRESMWWSINNRHNSRWEKKTERENKRKEEDKVRTRFETDLLRKSNQITPKGISTSLFLQSTNLLQVIGTCMAFWSVNTACLMLCAHIGTAHSSDRRRRWTACVYELTDFRPQKSTIIWQEIHLSVHSSNWILMCVSFFSVGLQIFAKN